MILFVWLFAFVVSCLPAPAGFVPVAPESSGIDHLAGPYHSSINRVYRGTVLPVNKSGKKYG